MVKSIGKQSLESIRFIRQTTLRSTILRVAGGRRILRPTGGHDLHLIVDPRVASSHRYGLDRGDAAGLST